ncbi:threonine/serine exporter family protein [Mesorhizobium sp. AR10]|nr:threonine/serine exporter family protein [Mesorhizobium sp. AR10]
MVAGSLVGAFAAGLLARRLAQHFKIPVITFAFPGVVAMIPGATLSAPA